MVTTTVRFPEELYQQITDFARENEFSKNQVIKMAVREFLQRKRVVDHGDSEAGERNPRA